MQINPKPYCICIQKYVESDVCVPQTNLNIFAAGREETWVLLLLNSINIFDDGLLFGMIFVDPFTLLRTISIPIYADDGVGKYIVPLLVLS